MAFFQYRAADRAGKILEGVMEAEVEQSVVARLHEMGCVPLKITLPGSGAARTREFRLPLFKRRRISQRQLLQFTQELETLLAAGLPLDRSLSILGGLLEGKEFNDVMHTLLEAVRAGNSLAGAMGQHPDVFPKLYVNMIRAGETGGILDSTLRYLVDYLENTLALKEEVKSALIYPLILTLVAGVSLIVLFVYVIPRFASMFQDVGQALPWVTRMVLGSSEFLREYGWVLLLVLAVGAAGTVRYISTAAGKEEWDRFCLRLWLIGDLVRKFETSRFARTLSSLLRGGVPLLHALGTVQGVVGNRLLANAISQVQVRVR
jgi:general secretion pathway protein F